MMCDTDVDNEFAFMALKIPRPPLPTHASEFALVHYGADGTFTVIKPGRYVVCAVSGIKIPLALLRYWDADRQEAYAGPAEVLARRGLVRSTET